MSSIYDVKSTLTQTALNGFCQKYYLPDVVHPELPTPNQSIRDSPVGKIGVYTRLFDFANFRIPLSQFLVDVLKYFRINLSQLSVIVAAKVSHFEILCRVHGYVSTAGLFRRFYVNSKNKGWMSFGKRSDIAPVCYTKPLDSLKHWNDSFFWVDASVFPLSVPWHTKKTLVRDPPLTTTEFSAEAYDFLATYQAPFRKFSEPFLCLVGLSRYYDLDDDVYPTFLTDAREGRDGSIRLYSSCGSHQASGNEKGGQNDNVEVAGPHDLNEEGGDAKQENRSERDDRGGQDDNIVVDDDIQVVVANNPKRTRKKRKATCGLSGFNPPPKKLREDHGTSGDAGASTAGKSFVALHGLLDRSTLAAEVGVSAAKTVPFVTSSVTLTPERKGGGHTDYVFGPNLRTHHPAERFVIFSDSYHHSSTNADVEVTSIVRSSIPPPPVMTAAVAATAVAGTSPAPVLGAGIQPVIHSLSADSASLSKVGPNPVVPSNPRGIELSTDTFYISQEMDSETLQQIYTCLSAEVRLRSEHSLRERKKFKRKCVRQTDLLKEKDAEITSLKAQLSLKEAEAAEAIRSLALEGEKITLEGRVATLESSDASKDNELAFKDSLTDQISVLETTCFELHDQVSDYELFKEQHEAVKDEQVKILSDRVAELDSELMGMAVHMDEELYPRFLTTIAGRRWIISCGFRLAVMKCLQSPEYVSALETAIGLVIDKGMHIGLVAGIDHGKAGRGLVEIAAYDPFVEERYVSAVIALRGLDFNFLSQLECRRMPALFVSWILFVKEGALSHRLSISEAMGPLVDPLSSENLVGEASTSGVLATAATTTPLSVSVTSANVSSIPPI
ncbi:hypothetical protein Tco_1069063 [Tanacetum coccineum]|uniref:Transposase (putative) gypsy type domain-containing protein n=1 Tax=Tanacetum coccineum TaxID=301880 RepID=A0ABQ5HHG0_9ASTR